MTNQEAIDWLRLLKYEDIEFDDYSEGTKELREKAIVCFQEALDLGIQALENQLTLEDISRSLIDFEELRHRFGDEVEAVVRDMVTGQGKRWEK